MCLTLEFLEVSTLEFAPKVDEGFLLGYASNAHGYRVFNKTSGCVEIACDVTFNESNGSQGEQVGNVVGMEEPSSQAIKKLTIGEIKSQEQMENEYDDDDELIFQGPSTSTSAAQPRNSGYEAGDSGHHDRSIWTPSRSIRATQAEMTTQHQNQSQDDREAEPIQHQFLHSTSKSSSHNSKGSSRG